MSPGRPGAPGLPGGRGSEITRPRSPLGRQVAEPAWGVSLPDTSMTTQSSPWDGLHSSTCPSCTRCEWAPGGFQAAASALSAGAWPPPLPPPPSHLSPPPGSLDFRPQAALAPADLVGLAASQTPGGRAGAVHLASRPALGGSSVNAPDAGPRPGPFCPVASALGRPAWLLCFPCPPVCFPARAPSSKASLAALGPRGRRHRQRRQRARLAFPLLLVPSLPYPRGLWVHLIDGS